MAVLSQSRKKDKYYSVNIDILEKNGRITVYNTKLKEVDAQTLNPSIIPTSSKASITENGDKYQTINNDNRVYNIRLNRYIGDLLI